MKDTSPTGLSPEVRRCRSGKGSDRARCYLELMSIAVFKGGLNYNVVNAKWDAIASAFKGFDVHKVAAMTERDIARIEADPGVIHNQRKIEGVVHNARAMVELEGEFGGMAEWLDTLPDPETRIAELHRRFAFMGPTTAYYFLHYSGEPVPGPHEWAQDHPAAGRAHHGERRPARPPRVQA